MTVTAQMFDTHPRANDIANRDALLACIDACLECGQACTTCADACLSEEMVADLTTCIRLNQDCADLCDTTARLLSRHTGTDTTVLRCAQRAPHAPPSATPTRTCTSTAGSAPTPAAAVNRPALTCSRRSDTLPPPTATAALGGPAQRWRTRAGSSSVRCAVSIWKVEC